MAWMTTVSRASGRVHTHAAASSSPQAVRCLLAGGGMMMPGSRSADAPVTETLEHGETLEVLLEERAHVRRVPAHHLLEESAPPPASPRVTRRHQQHAQRQRQRPHSPWSRPSSHLWKVPWPRCELGGNCKECTCMCFHQGFHKAHTELAASALITRPPTATRHCANRHRAGRLRPPPDCLAARPPAPPDRYRH